MKTQNPLIGRSRKSYGNATFYTLNGENIVRTKAEIVSNPNTPAQEAQRVRFRAFTSAANSVSEDDLMMLFASNEVGRNRRSILQKQLAPAYGSQPSTDPTSAERFESTFDVSKIDKIGNGAIGYEGDFVIGAASSNGVVIGANDLQVLKNNMVLDGTETHVFLVAIADDGCIIKVANPITMTEMDNAISGETEMNFSGLDVMADHGEYCNVYAIGGKLQLIGLGTFAIAERKARKGHDPRHNKVIGG